MPFSAFHDPDIYRDILDGLQIGVSVLDLQNRIVFWSDGAEHITGYARIDVLGHACKGSIYPQCNDDRCEMCTEKCPKSIALHDGKPVEAMTFIHHKSGHRIQVHTWAIPLRDRHGSIIGLIQTIEGEFSVTAPNSNDQSMAERGWLDDLTGLPGQAMMQSHLREMLGTFAELHIPFGIIFLEIKDLVQLRARYGQVAARSLVQVLARTLRNTVWPTDLVGRWSEDQFLVIMSGGEEALHAVSGRMLRMAGTTSIKWWGEELSVAVFTGHTSAMAGDSYESILQRAQLRLRGKEGLPAAMAAAGGNSSSSS